VTNDVGVDINRAVVDSYYRLLLPFVCGLGPRKAQALIQSISNVVSRLFKSFARISDCCLQGGTLVNRDQFIKSGLLTTKIFLNAAGFLRINYEAESGKRSKNRHDNDDVADPLDNTRVHPEDYELARKMATDALELDEEDVQDEHPSHVISLLVQADDRHKKLDELNLDDFAVNMNEANGDRKRNTLELIKTELITPFGDHREKFIKPLAWEVLTMLSGQTPRTLRPGFIVDCLITRVSKTTAYLRLDSGIEGTVDCEYAADTVVSNMDEAHVRGKTCAGVIIDIKLDLPRNHFSIEMSTRPADVKSGADSHLRRIKHDEYWNLTQYDRDQELLARKKRAEVGEQRRIIKHPNFHSFKSLEAEKFLSTQQRGDVVIRPSSKGVEHLAVTWKVDDNLYQHIGESSTRLTSLGRS
jgi:transcription elongation factor SPT6